MASVFSRQLNRIVHEGRFTVVELADVVACSQRHIYAAADTTSPSELGLERAEALSRYLCSHGETRLALGMLSPAYVIKRGGEGVADGCVKDEVLRAVDAAVGAKRAHTRRDPEALRLCIDDLTQVIRDLTAEMALIG